MVKLCKKCRNNKSKWGGICKCGYYPFVKNDIYTCPDTNCNGELIDIDICDEDFIAITEISTDVNFIESMINLKKQDPIEYQLKMSQFKTQVEQQKQLKKSEEESSKPHCPHCHSTDIKPISGLSRGASIAMWGIFSKKINKSFECKNCGYTW